MTPGHEAIRATVRGDVSRRATVQRALDLGVLGWVRCDEDGLTRVHVEGDARRR